MAKVEGMRGKDNSKPVLVKKGAPNTTPTFRSNNNNFNSNNKRPNAGRDAAGDKRVKMEGRQLSENFKFCDKPGHRAEECWKKLGACLRCGGRDHRIPDCPMIKDQPGRAQNGFSVDTTWANVDTLSQHSPEGVLGRSLVSTLPDLVSTLPDQFYPKGVLEGY
ncbi:hypothetical protein Taro_008158 [Colocasia esculenta]|uniref:CCHC-type domain-containing protein n=1 Tax=Colocasia esculenta TaxID=4460 RepID=A0A843TWT8_COLES|nr:hypothetical protein [Colocasia esculenta]